MKLLIKCFLRSFFFLTCQKSICYFMFSNKVQINLGYLSKSTTAFFSQLQLLIIITSLASYTNYLIFNILTWYNYSLLYKRLLYRHMTITTKQEVEKPGFLTACFRTSILIKEHKHYLSSDLTYIYIYMYKTSDLTWWPHCHKSLNTTISPHILQ